MSAVGFDALSVVALACAALAAAILVRHLVTRPPLTLINKLWLFAGLGVLPALSATTSTVTGMHATTERRFCGSCHVMQAHYDDANNPKSQSLAARHSRNAFFGDRSCYVCHADYGMYGYVITKSGGMRHVYKYYFEGYDKMSLQQAVKTIRLAKPYDNLNCRQCHTTSLKDWNRVPEHHALEQELATNKVSCASAGCHGYAHPFSKPKPTAEPSRGSPTKKPEAEK